MRNAFLRVPARESGLLAGAALAAFIAGSLGVPVDIVLYKLGFTGFKTDPGLGVLASRQQHAHSPITKDAPPGIAVDWGRVASWRMRSASVAR